MSYRFTNSKLSSNLYGVYHCCVYSEKIPDDGQRNFPKHVEFYSKIKYEKFVHLVGFIIRIFTTNIRALNYLEIFDLDTSAILTIRSIELQTYGVQCRPFTRFWFHWITSSLLASLQGGNGKNLADEIRFSSPAESTHWKESYILTGSSF